MSMSKGSQLAGNGLSEEARGRLEEELDVLRGQRGALGTDSDEQGVGDRADDAEALQRLNDAALLDERIAEVTRLLATGAPQDSVADHGLPDGTAITLRHGDGTVETLRAVRITALVPEGEEDSSLTLDSPLGQAIAGHRAGDTVSYQTPAGPRRAEIVTIRPPGH